eukprot:s5428_g2.t1
MAGVDAYHVALQHLFGCEGSYHLLAFKLDFESQAVPDAAPAARVDSTMMPLLPSAARRPQVSSQASSRSGGTLLQTLPNLEELMMLVGDGSQQPVCQIHFKYRAKKGSSTSAAGRCDAAGEDTLPPLRTFIRPTDWETVRSSIARYAAGERCQIDLPRVYVKAFDRQSGYIQSRRVAVNPCLESARRGYMWLHFRDLRFEEKMPRAPGELAELVEAGVVPRMMASRFLLAGGLGATSTPAAVTGLATWYTGPTLKARPGYCRSYMLGEPEENCTWSSFPKGRM